MYYFSISIVIVANIFYTFFQSVVPNEVNPVISLCCMYVGGSLIVIPFYLKNMNKYKARRHKFGLRVILFAITNILIDLGFLLAFRSGWQLSNFSVISSVAILVLLAFTGTIIFKEKLSFINIVGIITGVIGLLILNI